MVLYCLYYWHHFRLDLFNQNNQRNDKKNNFTLITPKVFDDLIIYLIFGIILGGRLGYVIFYNFEYYSQNLFEILKLWKGGMSFHGGLLGVIIATIIFSKIKKLTF